MNKAAESEEQATASSGPSTDVTESRFRLLADAAPAILWVSGPDGACTYLSRGWYEHTGQTEEEALGFGWLDALHPDDREEAARAFRKANEAGEPFAFDYRLRRADGEHRWALEAGRPLFGRAGERLGFVGSVIDIHERKQSEERLTRSEEQLRLVTDALPALVSFIDADLRYRFVNGGYERWFGQPKESVIGRHLSEVLGREAFEAIAGHLRDALSGSRVTYEAHMQYQAGGTKWIEATYIPQRAPDGRVEGIVALVSDVTERRPLERFRAEAMERTERLLKVATAIADAVSHTEVYAALVDGVADAVGASTAGLFLVDQAEHQVRMVRSRGYAQATNERFAALNLDREPTIPLLDAIKQREPLWLPSQAALLERYPHLDGHVTAGRSYRFSILPLVAHDRTLGALALSEEKEGEASREEKEFLLLVARYATQSLERLRLFEAERESRAEADRAVERLRLLNRISRAIADADLDPNVRLGSLVREIGAAFQSSTSVFLLEHDGKLHPAALFHPNAEANELLQSTERTTPLEVGEGISGRVAATGESVLIPLIGPEMRSQSAQGYRSFLDRFPAYAVISVPLRARGRTLGVVSASRVRSGETFTPEDLRLLEEVAERAGVALENSRLFKESIEARSRAEHLQRFAQAVVSAEKVEAVFEAALDTVETALEVKRAAILTFDEDGITRVRARRGIPDDLQQALDGYSPWLGAVDAEVFNVPDALTEPRVAQLAPFCKKDGMTGLVFLPLATRGRLLGALMACYVRPAGFPEHELETVRAVANYLSSAIARFGAIGKLEETIRFNELFAGILAHDLRNPLNAIMMAAELVLMRTEGEPAKLSSDTKPLSKILSSGRRMATMIEQLLDFSRVRSGGGIAIHSVETNLANLCDNVVEELSLAHPEWQIRREVLGEPNGLWDPDRLLQVVSNLVANAGQHGSEHGEIRVRVDGTSAEWMVLEVHNRGAIPASVLATLFDPFRTTRATRTKSQGLGLGLFIVREIVRAHGGTVTVRSSEPSGTTFVVQLPRESSQHQAGS